MTNLHMTNPKIEELARAFGVPQNTIYQWRSRGVSDSWKIILVVNSNGSIKLKDFPDYERYILGRRT